jgi:hypothetical protein
LNGRYLTTVVAESRFSAIDDVLVEIKERLYALPCSAPKLIDAEICSPPRGCEVDVSGFMKLVE